PVPPRDEAAPGGQGRGSTGLSARGVHAGGVPRVGRRIGRDGAEDVADLVVLSAAGGTAVEPEIHHSSRRGTPHAGGHDPRRPCGKSHAMTSRTIDGPTLSDGRTISTFDDSGGLS